jgi:flagellar biosynthetic protein FlhB
MEYMAEVFRADEVSRMRLEETGTLREVAYRGLRLVAAVGLPVSLAGFFVGIVASFAQVGSIFTFEPLQWDLAKINPLQGLQRLLSIKHILDSLRVLLKTVLAGYVAYLLVKSRVLDASGILGVDAHSVAGLYGSSARAIFLSLLGVFGVFALVDFFLQRWEWSKKVRLTKQEAKQEHKEKEGDPQIKARVRSIQREMSRRRMMEAVKKADVIITNPTHIAIAIQYQQEKMAAPRVVAKGADFVAQKIKKMAQEAGIPLVENVPLARTLYKSVKLNHTIPRALYQAVAEVLAYVYRLKKGNLGNQQPGEDAR